MSNAPLDKAYDPKAVETDINQLWLSNNAFHADPAAGGEPFCIVIPPPNVTAALHMGHALNNTIQDILTRHHRMLGDNSLWMPGTDHAGIATQAIVDKRLKAEGQPALAEYKKLELENRGGREQFIAKVQLWKDEYEATITNQLKAMGCSCDWDRQRFTMDPVCIAAVREAFYLLFRDGLIYRGKRLVNWDPASQTALADDEVEMREIEGFFHYLRYPLIEPVMIDGKTFDHITVATTRPETMLGDTAVAINPRDPRAAALKGRFVRLPIVNRVIPIVEDDYVVLPVELGGAPEDAKAQFATGFLKVTPAHDPNDYEIGRRHNLPVVNIMAPDGSISDKHGWSDIGEGGFLVGQSREAARQAIIKWFEQNNLLQEIKPYTHSVGHSYRSHVPIEPYLSDQWYVKVTDDRLASAALNTMALDQRGESAGCSWKSEPSFAGEAAEATLRFHPARYARTFQTWHENIRDWCISRQLWWGHRIPVWTGLALMPAKDALINETTDEELQEYQRELQKRLDDYANSLGCPQAFSARAYCDGGDYRVRICVRNAEADRHFQQLCGYTNSDIKLATLPGDTYAGKIAADIANWVIDLVQDPDVLDTWFSSALWPMSTLGWPNPELFPAEIPEGSAVLDKWNPTSVLCTGREIITLWVSRMVMFNLYFLKRLPFRDVFIHAMIQDGDGQKMSKSLGNGVDPLDIIHSHGADGMRFTLASMTTHTQDVRMPVDVVCPHSGQAFKPKTIRTASGHMVAAPIQISPADPSKKMVSSFGIASGQAKATPEMPVARNTSSKFDFGRNFANKLWNAVRFALMNLEGLPPCGPENPADYSLADRWIRSRLASTLRTVDQALADYQFNHYIQASYDFFWRDLCDWYLEAIKPVVRETTPGGEAARRTLMVCLDACLRILHPAIPYITEKLFSALNDAAPQRSAAGIAMAPSSLLINAAWPLIDASWLCERTEKDFALIQEIIGAIRNIRNEYNLPPKKDIQIKIKATTALASLLGPSAPLIANLANAIVQEIGTEVARPDDAAVQVIGDLEIYACGLIDPQAERDRLSKQLEQLTKSRTGLHGRLNNKGYIDRAPAHLVEETRKQLADVESEIARVEAGLAQL